MSHSMEPAGLEQYVERFRELLKEHFIDLSRLERHRAIGRGAFGVVRKGTYDGMTVAIKEVALTDDSAAMLQPCAHAKPK